MKIVNLIENTEGVPGCAYEHGLSFYVETTKHKVVMDLGQTDGAILNAEALGIDLKAVDTVVLSHGHYDHSGGILPFSKLNKHALIYMQKDADGEYFADDGEIAEGERYKYIGIDKDILKLSQVRLIRGDYRLDDDLELFTIKQRTHKLPFPNSRLLIRDKDGFLPDDFGHEQYLVIRENGLSVMISGCAHNGMLSIMDAYIEKYGKFPDVVISGFHLMVDREYREEEWEEIRAIANKLKTFPTKFFTGHCTGIAAFEEMKRIMGEKLSYVSSGETVEV